MDISALDVIFWVFVVAMIIVFLIVNLRARARGTGGDLSDDV